jgi:dienelactone hydrolase
LIPAGTPKGLIWVQHGFLRSGSNIADLASKYAAQGYIAFAPTLPTANIYGCTLEDIGNNTDFLENVADLFGQALDASEKLARSFAAAAASAGRSDLTLPADLVLSGHSAGGEAVIYVANRLRTTYPVTWTGLHGLVLLDPVKSFIGDNMESGLQGLDNTTVGILTISAALELCNDFDTGTDEVQSQVHRDFVGVRITTGVHTDAEGATTDIVGELACGFLTDSNVAILQTLAVGWADDFFGGTTTATYYPGGSYYASQLSAGTISTLAGAS